jgi:hypothetical protein
VLALPVAIWLGRSPARWSIAAAIARYQMAPLAICLVGRSALSFQRLTHGYLRGGLPA